MSSAPHTAVRVTGVVTSSRKYSDTRGQAVHELMLSQGTTSLPILARRCFGPAPGGHIVASRLERHFRPGAPATVCGQALHLDRKRQLLVLTNPDHIELASQAQEAAAA